MRQNIVTRVVSTLLSWAGLDPSMSNSPAAPAQTPLLWAVLAFARKEIDSLRNQTPDVGAASVTTSLAQSPNLLVNPGAEFGNPSLSGFSSVTVPGWTVTGTPTVIQYGTKVRLPLGLSFPGPTVGTFPRASSAPPGSGNQFFGGGNVATSTITQVVDLNDASALIDAGNLPFTLSAALGGKGMQRSAASVTVNFLDQNHLFISSGKIAPVTPLNRLFRTGLFERETSGMIPTGARYAQVVVTFTDKREYNNAYADDLSFTVGDPSLTAPTTPTAPASTVGSLDHVFMVYMENKGYTNIVGSPNAPYMNSLINTYGFASNYYALTHPSLPNYYPILGGSDFGINYNCPSNCFDKSNLVDEIEAAHKTWAAYEQNGGGTSSPGQTPFLAFDDIANDPARVANIKPLTDMAGALESAATTPNFVWFQPDEDHNGEGPIDTIGGALSFVLNQFTPGHQYNVKAADQFLQDTLPTILNSNVWKDETQKSAIIVTFDEDNNNLSLGFGNEGNHIVTIVIPSPGAVAAGMREGPFIATNYYNHYSLQRTIEDALGLAPLTQNDAYAQPMNEFWQQPVAV